jgi:hypothetical protein
MALSKVKTNATGITTTYHRVNDVILQDNSLNCSLCSYVSQEYREANRPADYSHFEFEITLEEEESMGIRKLCCKKIKELPEWAEAADC